MSAGVLIDWSGGGFGATIYDDVTADVLGWTITRGSAPEITGAAGIGSCTLLLDNRSGRYSPSNGSSPIHDDLVDGRPVWIGIGADGTFGGSPVYGLFAGRIRDIAPIPAGGAATAPTCEIVCEDPLAWYGRQEVTIADSTTRSQQTLRQAILDAIGETRYALAPEITTLPLSSASGDALSVLTALNAANGTRHFIRPADNASDWYDYVTVTRMQKLDGTADSTLNAAAASVISVDGWRKSGDTALNRQTVSITPISFPIGLAQVWAASDQTLPISVVSGSDRTLWANFDDFVSDAAVDVTSTGDALTVTLTSFGTTAKLVLSSAGTSTVSRLAVNGHQVIRDQSISIVADDLSSQAVRGVRSASDIQGDLVGTQAAAQGIATHMVWRYANPLIRPTVTVANWYPDMFARNLFDLVAFSSSQLSVTGLVMEIVGLTHTGSLAASTGTYHTVAYQLQESRVQTPTQWFTTDVSTSDGPDLLGY